MNTQMNSLTIIRLKNVIKELGSIDAADLYPQEVVIIAQSIETIQDIIQHN